MARTTKSPIALAKVALAAGKRALPDYSHHFSPHKFTQPQLFAILTLRQFLKTDYRGMVQMLREWSDLRQALGHRGSQLLHPLLRPAAASKKNAAARLFDATLEEARRVGLIPATSRLAAIDSTGLESRHVSHYFTRRMVKRRLGSALTARSCHSQNRETALRLLTHNLMILLCLRLREAFQQSRSVPSAARHKF